MRSTWTARRGRIVSAAVAASALALALPTSAYAASGRLGGSKTGGAGGGSSTVGNDISYPQCGGAYPSGQAFGIVGLNGGMANDWNTCFTGELSWAAGSSGAAGQPKAQIYLNTGDPGPGVSDWPTSGTSNYGTCDGTDTPACAFQYGYQRAQADLARVNSPAGYTWWLDVETANSWQSGSAALLDLNSEDLQGMEQAFLDASLPRAGVYSTSYQWGVITGGNTAVLAGVPNWEPGARTQRGAQSNCTALSPFTGGSSKIVLTQWTATYDYDYACS